MGRRADSLILNSKFSIRNSQRVRFTGSMHVCKSIVKISASANFIMTGIEPKARKKVNNESTLKRLYAKG